jgi:ABC-2 type transport system ATP-binding protein
VPIIEVEGLVKTYAGVKAVDGISFTVDEGEIFGIVGPNGAGKTTTVESVEGLRRPDAGTIRVLGLDPIRDRYEITERVGAQLQESRIQDRIKVAEVLELYASFYREPADWRGLLERLGLGGRESARYSALSGGQKQKLSVALALVGSPEIAVLDELTTGLDPQSRRSTWDTIEQIRNDGVTVVLVTHFMEEAERLCDRVMVVARGRVVAVDTPAGLVRRIGSGSRLTFRPSAPVDDALLTGLPEVERVERRGGKVIVDGTGNVVQSVTALLVARNIVAEELRVEQQTLEDAYLELTGETGAGQEDG